MVHNVCVCVCVGGNGVAIVLFPNFESLGIRPWTTALAVKLAVIFRPIIWTSEAWISSGVLKLSQIDVTISYLQLGFIPSISLSRPPTKMAWK